MAHLDGRHCLNLGLRAPRPAPLVMTHIPVATALGSGSSGPARDRPGCRRCEDVPVSIVLGHPCRPAHPCGSVRLAATALVAILLCSALAGCGGDDDAGADPPAGTETTASSSVTNGGAPAEPVDVDTLAEASGGAASATGTELDDPPGDPERTATVADVGETAASVTAADGTVTGCCLLVAATDEQRQRGLMEVTDLGGYQGMVFVYADDSEGGFWMRNTPTPLSIAWFDAEGAFVSATDMAPCPGDESDCPIYPPEGPYRFAVEVFQGDLDELGIGPGSRLRLGGDCVDAAP
jgi:uncharacterized protein